MPRYEVALPCMVTPLPLGDWDDAPREPITFGCVDGIKIVVEDARDAKHAAHEVARVVTLLVNERIDQ